MSRPTQAWLWWAVMMALTLAGAWLGLMGGSEGLDTEWRWSDPIVQDLRWPRTQGAWLAGALLGLAGAVAQGLFRNPLADPYLLGSASGAAFGVVVAITVMGGAALAPGLAWAQPWVWRLGLTGSAFVGAWAAVLLTLALARGAHHGLRLLLSGVVVGVVLGAVTSLWMVAAPQAWSQMQSFLLGSTAMIAMPSVLLMAGVLLPALGVALAMSRWLDGLRLGEDTARSLGLPMGLLHWVLVGVLALCTATSVAQAGLIAFVGLVAPHLVRAGHALSYRALLLRSVVMGGWLLGIADVLARICLAPRELPVGILTAVLGGAYLLWQLQRQTHGGMP
ncbi:MAG: iron ABC transporter permease [Betaproteobacteria bacterium]|nr:iron ABC transporter permease [Betaproteobacteria bacterium]NBY04096.1 iron ABC transporter permease [Betaproteobacteria bacterium]